MLRKIARRVGRSLIILIAVFLFASSVFVFISLSRAIDVAQNFSKEYARGLRFVKPYIAYEDKKRQVSGLNLIFADAEIAVNLYRGEVEEARLKIKGFTRENFDPSDPKAWAQSRKIAIQFAKTLYKDFNKRNMACDEGENMSCSYIYHCRERIKVGQYDVPVDGNELTIIVHCLDNFVNWYSPAFQVHVSPDMFKPLVVDKNKARSIAIDFIQNKVRFPINHIGVSGPFFGKSSKKDNNAPRKIFWYIFMSSGDVEGAIVGNGNVRVDTATGKILDYSYDEWPRKKPKLKAVRKVKVR